MMLPFAAILITIATASGVFHYIGVEPNSSDSARIVFALCGIVALATLLMDFSRRDDPEDNQKNRRK